MEWHHLTAADAAQQLSSDLVNGLTDSGVIASGEKYGENKITGKKQKSLFKRFLLQFCDFMIVILLIAAAVSFVTSFLQGDGDITDPIIILAIVILNAVIGVVQESRAQHAIEALKKISAPETQVIRNGKTQKVHSMDIVRGDIILLETGDLVPADARLIESVNLKTEESSLTGESLPVEKSAQAVLAEKTIVAERKNMVYSGSVVVAGRGRAIVTEIGMHTQIGQIAGLINNASDGETPLQARLAKTGKVLGMGALVVCMLVFLLGILHGFHILDTFMIAVSLAVAAIPEGLPAIVTVVLALGVQRMAKKNAIIRRLPACETLGGATVICTDKTGTLTMNKMEVKAVADISGRLPQHEAAAKWILECGTLCNNSTVNRTEDGMDITGDPTETAIVAACVAGGTAKAALEGKYPRIGEIPFDSKRKLMTTIHKLPDGYRVITKGAPDYLIKKCTKYKKDTGIYPLSGRELRNIEQINDQLASEAMRVLCVAYKDVTTNPSGREESDLVFLGLIGLADPPREDVKEAVLLCMRAGIRPIMITGDHLTTATAIAKQTGILKKGSIALTGSDLDAMDDKELKTAVKKCCVFARVTPEHKMRIVKALQRCGEVVAMTGDGVNDAPALKAADIGCAMGKIGTEVAKSAADMVLTDDNFSTIVSAVKEGRGIYDNIRKAVHFLLSCNIGEILTIFAASLFNLPTPLFAIQLLWVNLVTDSLPAIALGLEPVEPDVMYRKPVRKEQSLFHGGLFWDILLQGCMIGAFTLLGFTLGNVFYSLETGRTIAFAVLSLSQLVHAFNVRSRHSVFDIGLFSNKVMCLSFVVCAALQISVITIPVLAGVFKTVPLDPLQWMLVVLLSALPLAIMEFVKGMRD